MKHKIDKSLGRSSLFYGAIYDYFDYSHCNDRDNVERNIRDERNCVVILLVLGDLI